MSSSPTEGNSAEGMSNLQLTGNSTVPPGFRFHPTDEELVGYYLTKKVACSKIDLDVIREIDLYKLEPWDLQERCRIGSAEQHEWYFFSHKDKKYPTGTRTNRATTAGFWKATGRDKPIFAKVKLIGMRKTLVFYKGRAPNGQKSDWIMHEYRLEDDINNTTTNEEGWVVCRVFKKRNIVKKPSSDYDGACCYEEEPPEKVSASTHYSNNLVKQELEGGFYFPFSYDSFSQLPRLESPKRSCDIWNSSAIGIIEDHSSRGMEYGHFTDFEELVQLQPKSLTPQPDQFHTFNEDLVAAWGMDDRILAEMSQDDYSKETRFSAGNSTTEVAQRLSKGQQQQPEYSYDVDLWSFNR